MKKRSLLFALLALCLSSLAQAGMVSQLYQAKLLVPEQNTAPEAGHLREGLSQVLVKVSGQRGLLGKPLLQQQLASASAYLERYAYQTTTQISQNEQGTQRLQQLTLEFSAVAVNDLLQRAGVALVGEQRPTVLLWLASDLYGNPELMGTDSRYYPTLQQVAAERGVPLQLPLLDLEDQASLPVSDLWGLFATPVEDASLRYLPDVVLAARLQYQANGSTELSWILINRGTPQRQSTSGTPEQVLSEMLQQTADQLFAPMAQADLSFYQSGVALQVSNVSTFDAYLRLVDLLQSLPLVKAVNPAEIGSGMVTLRLQLEGSEQQLQQAISLDSRLVLLDILRNSDGAQTYSYRWQE
ncbi:DUF2066 domain-containing protein [Pontibacter sp. JAM-7]|uniref:DUF2066 domain-containing protein n=1 Tax=Pontibacter sp. JAM-7 TaxID=3366581 RepID=UPI003AF8EF77